MRGKHWLYVYGGFVAVMTVAPLLGIVPASTTTVGGLFNTLQNANALYYVGVAKKVP